MLAPAGTPKPIIAKLYAALVKSLAMPDVKELILKAGSKPAPSPSPEAFGQYIKAETEKFHPVIKAAGLEGTQ
jgi:tripartite-type tricarboxylate transporter receptor subunit TctC